jgi:hypothetical protein
MKLFSVSTITKIGGNETIKHFIVMAEDDRDVRYNLKTKCSTYSEIYDRILTIVELSGMGVRVM